MPQFEIVDMVLQYLKDSQTNKFISVWSPGGQAENISVWREGLKAKWFFHSYFAEPLGSLQGQNQTMLQVMPLDHPRMKEVTLPSTELCSSANPLTGDLWVGELRWRNGWKKSIYIMEWSNWRTFVLSSRLHHCKSRRTKCVSFITSVITPGIWDWNIST